MPSFDLVSEIDKSQLLNAIEFTKKMVAGRYDFKGTETTLVYNEKQATIEMRTADQTKMRALLDIFRGQLAKREIGLNAVEAGEVESTSHKQVKLELKVKSGISKEDGKKINKVIKNSGLKVSSSVMDEKVRVTGKKIDDLQQVMSVLKTSKEINLELQMENMKR